MPSHRWPSSFLPDKISIYWTCTCKHIKVHLLTCGLCKIYCVLLCYYGTSIVIFLNLMICGRLLGLPCKQFFLIKLEIFQFQTFLKFKPTRWFCGPVETNYHIPLFLYFLSHSICNIYWNWFTNRPTQRNIVVVVSLLFRKETKQFNDSWDPLKCQLC